MADSAGDDRAVAVASEAADRSTATPMEGVSFAASQRTDHDRLYFLPTAPVKRSRVHASQNLISDYGLDSVHEKVRRFDAKTGEKIAANKLRKSYVGIVKTLHLAGANKEVPAVGQWVKTADGAGQGLLEMDDEAWRREAPLPVTRSVADGMLAKLDKAIQMAPGRLDDSDKWKKLLGDDLPKKPSAPVANLKQNNGFLGRPSPKLGAQSGRSQRAAAKRKYDDASFAGYEETFEDVGGAADYKKARKDIPITQPLLMAGGTRQR